IRDKLVTGVQTCALPISIFTVGSTADTGGCAKPPSGTTCTLRQLVNLVPASSTISVPAGTYTLTAGELLIDQNLTITGAGARTRSEERRVGQRGGRGGWR